MCFKMYDYEADRLYGCPLAYTTERTLASSTAINGDNLNQ